MHNKHRLVVFTGSLSYTVLRNIVDLDERLNGLSWLIMVHSPRKTPSQLLKSQRTNLKKNGWRWIPYQTQDLLTRFLSKRLPAAPQTAPGSKYELPALRARSNVRIEYVNDIHAHSSLLQIRDFAPDLGLSLAAPILKPELFNLPRLGTINLHKGRLPDFRGMPPAFWEIWCGQDRVGCSVHRVNEQLDAGELLAAAETPIYSYSTPRGVQIRLDEIGSDLICDTTIQLLAGTPPKIAQPSGAGKTWRKPTLQQKAQLKARLDRQEPHPQPSWRRRIKDLLATLSFAWHRTLGWRLTKPRITVLLYHRVSDEVRDNLTVGVAQFERQMELLRQHCDILSIEQILQSPRAWRSKRPLVAVSFDDGYLDNYLNAVPILRRQRVPCSFYVSTGMLQSGQRFPHDIRRGNAPIPTMNWDQLRTMHQWGFTIGSHTVNHIDCVAEPLAKVDQELKQSSYELRQELGLESLIFAYPYGGRHQMNDTVRQRVRELGFQGCLAAYGGSNIDQVDRWNVLRRGIHWEFSDAAFLQQCLGY